MDTRADRSRTGFGPAALAAAVLSVAGLTGCAPAADRSADPPAPAVARGGQRSVIANQQDVPAPNRRGELLPEPCRPGAVCLPQPTRAQVMNERVWPLIDAMVAAGLPTTEVKTRAVDFAAAGICDLARRFGGKPEGLKLAAGYHVPWSWFDGDPGEDMTFRQLAVDVYCPEMGSLPR